jgi:hypothetical protein
LLIFTTERVIIGMKISTAIITIPAGSSPQGGIIATWIPFTITKHAMKNHKTVIRVSIGLPLLVRYASPGKKRTSLNKKE